MSLKVGPEDKVPKSVFILVEDSAYFAHIGKPIVVLCSQGEFAEISER